MFALFCDHVLTLLMASEEDVSVERPFLVMRKRVSPTNLIEKDTVAVQIIVTNVGPASAYQVNVIDDFQGDKYGKELEKIDPGETMLVGYSKKVERLGEFYADPARAIYRLDLEEDSQRYFAYSTQTNEELPGELRDKQPIINILTSREYSQKYRYYAKEMATTAFFSVLTTILPFVIYKRNVALMRSK